MSKRTFSKKGNFSWERKIFTQERVSIHQKKNFDFQLYVKFFISSYFVKNVKIFKKIAILESFFINIYELCIYEKKDFFFFTSFLFFITFQLKKVVFFLTDHQLEKKWFFMDVLHPSAKEKKKKLNTG
ncbi:hypothetical protein RFI_20246 [Reticulomyxa filosa]|uniref:Uncharacterized protein n=1 Tax=Reticulomyxa filosa TaxID=46433 RepID=X6MSX7_RETFI|nr:hypothetical protein RFI_20246 [Reticulomyxa filosa]|eukprot:ETO17088.1 hypothetical protein RFI_20246 [Reticulomyxa filosa]